MRKTPYQHLIEEYEEFVANTCYPKEKYIWIYPYDKLSDGNWKLKNLYYKVQAAEELGFDVVLYTKKDGLHVKYIEKRKDIPWRFK